MSKRIVFISHEATITGAPLVLLLFLEYIKEKVRDWEVMVLFVRDGPLVKRVERLYPVIVLNMDPGIKFPQRLNQYVKVKSNERKLKSIFEKSVDLLYSNTIANGLLLSEIRKYYKGKILLHVHELPYVIGLFGEENLECNIKNADAFLFNSKLTYQKWQEISSKEVPYEIVYPLIKSTTTVKEINNSGKFIVGGCGNLTWRKGIDSFLFIAADIARIRKDIRFIWIGLSPKSYNYGSVIYLIEKLNLTELITLIPPTDDPYKYFSKFDLVAITSYEEPFSMVGAECASIGVPIFCWKGVVGAEEVFIPNAGMSVNIGEHKRAAKEIIKLLESKEKYSEFSRNAKTISKDAISLEKNASKTVAFINSLLED